MRWARLVFSVIAFAPLRAEVWETTDGARHEGKLSGVYGPVVLLSSKNASTLLTVDVLNDAALLRVADFLAAKPSAAVPWASSPSRLAKALKGRLQVLRDTKLVDFDSATRPEPEFYLAYFGADWCGPCRAFSPRLLAQYQRLKQLAPEKFEVVYMSNDRDGAEQLKYVRHVGMPWPVLRFSHVGRVDAIERWAGKGIPCLVVLTREGDALFHSYRGAEYVGPDNVLERFTTLLQAMNPDAPGAKRLMHRLAVAQHVRSAGTQSIAAKSYLVAMDLRRYQTLETKQIEATLAIDEHGRVTDVKLEPELPAVLNHQLSEDAATWLFLPAVENGRAQPKLVKLPLHIGR